MEFNWYKIAKNTTLKCPYCSFEGHLSSFITDGSRILTMEGFCFSECPKCGNATIFDYERMTLTRYGEGRKPFPLFLGIGRTLDFLIAALGLYFLTTGRFFWLPLIYILSVIIEMIWEIILKRDNPEWYWIDGTYDFVTDRITFLMLPLILARAAVVFWTIYLILSK